MSLRPKIVKLIDKYNQKKGKLCIPWLTSLEIEYNVAELVSMNESFVKAKTIFERMMEEALSRHTQGQQPASLSSRLLILLFKEYGGVPIIQQPLRQERPGTRQDYGQQRGSVYGWNTSIYDPAAAGGYNQFSPYVGPVQDYNQQQQPQYPQPAVSSPYGGPPNASQAPPYGPHAELPGYPQAQPAYQQGPPAQNQAPAAHQPPAQQSSAPEPAPYPQQPGGYQQGPTQTTAPLQPQHHVQSSASQAQPAGTQSGAQSAQTPPPQQESGPPYDYDPAGQY